MLFRAWGGLGHTGLCVWLSFLMGRRSALGFSEASEPKRLPAQHLSQFGFWTLGSGFRLLRLGV